MQSHYDDAVRPPLPRTTAAHNHASSVRRCPLTGPSSRERYHLLPSPSSHRSRNPRSTSSSSARSAASDPPFLAGSQRHLRVLSTIHLYLPAGAPLLHRLIIPFHCQTSAAKHGRLTTVPPLERLLARLVVSSTKPLAISLHVNETGVCRSQDCCSTDLQHGFASST